MGSKKQTTMLTGGEKIGNKKKHTLIRRVRAGRRREGQCDFGRNNVRAGRSQKRRREGFGQNKCF